MPLPPGYMGSGGRTFYLVASAAIRLGESSNDVRRRIAKGELSAFPISILVDTIPPTRGRPPTTVVPFDEVESLRSDLLAALGAVEPDSRPEPDPEGGRPVEVLEQANADLRGEVASLREVVRLGLLAEQARLEQIRLLMAPTGAPDSLGSSAP